MSSQPFPSGTPSAPPRKRNLSSTEKLVSVNKKQTSFEIPRFSLVNEDCAMDKDNMSGSKGKSATAGQDSKDSENTLQLILSKLSKLDVIES